MIACYNNSTVVACDKTVIRQFKEYLTNQNQFDFCSELDLSQSDDDIIDQLCQFMEIFKTDEILADFLTRYKVGGVNGDHDPKLATFECRWASLKRQFAMRGLIVKKNEFALTYTALKDRRHSLQQAEKMGKHAKNNKMIKNNLQRGLN